MERDSGAVRRPVWWGLDVASHHDRLQSFPLRPTHAGSRPPAQSGRHLVYLIRQAVVSLSRALPSLFNTLTPSQAHNIKPSRPQFSPALAITGLATLTTPWQWCCTAQTAQRVAKTSTQPVTPGLVARARLHQTTTTKGARSMPSTMAVAANDREASKSPPTSRCSESL